MMWDEDAYPEVSKEGIYHHGRYCQSGLAYKKSPWVSECVTINENDVRPFNETNKNEFISKLSCMPDGKT